MGANLEMKMRSSGPAGRALECDGRPARHHLTGRQTRRVPGQVAVVGRVAVPVDDHEQVAVADAARIEISDSRIGRDDLRAVWPGDVDPGVDLVRVRTVRVVYLEVERRAAKSLGDATRAARRLWPLEHPVPT